MKAVQVKFMLKPMLSAFSIQMVLSLSDGRRLAVPELVSALIHSRVIGERLSFTRRTLGIQRPELFSRPSCDQRWVICTRFAATLRCFRYSSLWKRAC